MIAALNEFFAWRKHGYADTQALGECLQAMVAEGLDQLPLPAYGGTVQRWQALASVAGHDLGLCKLYEGHTDALAIMAELGAPAPRAGSTWGTWASEPPQARVSVRGEGDALRLNGRKSWCSGAAVLSHALLTAWDEDDRQQLVALPLNQPGVRVTTDGWRAVGMSATGSVDVLLDQATGWRVGSPDAYQGRPGFWHGSIGIAAIWYGAARSIAQRLVQQLSKRDEPHALAHMGTVDVALHSVASVLQAAAGELDRAPTANVELLARRCRALSEQSAEQVMHHVGRALGAGSYCKDAHFARLIADLPVFLRQSHAEQDLAALGRLACEQAPSGEAWTL